MKNYIPLVQLAQKFKSKAKKFRSGSINEFLAYKELEVHTLIVPDTYQRDLSCGDINNYGQFNKWFFVPLIVAARPNGTYVVIDGQHKGVMALWSGCISKVPCMVLEHSKNKSDAECEKIEAEIFHAQNAKRKNPSYVDKMRAGYVFGLQEAIEYNNNLSACGLYVDSLGDVDGHQLNGEFQWRTAVKKYELATVMRAVSYAKDLDKVWKKGEVRGDIVYGLCALIKFLDDASGDINGRREKVLKFVSTEMAKSKVKVWYEGISGSHTDVLIARRIVKGYNALSSTANPQCIPPETLDHKDYGLKDPTK
jgi:hypothetical protein